MTARLCRQFSMRLDEDVARQLDLIGHVNGGVSRAKVIEAACRAYVKTMQTDPRFIARMRSYVERQQRVLSKTAGEFMDGSRLTGMRKRPTSVARVRSLKDASSDTGAADAG